MVGSSGGRKAEGLGWQAEGVRKREGRAAGREGRGQQAAVHQPRSTYTPCKLHPAAQSIDPQRHTPLGLSFWKAVLQGLLINYLPASSSHCLEATFSMQPPS